MASGSVFTSVSKHQLQTAFAYAHKLSEDESVPLAQRTQFRAIAGLIWRAHGETGEPKAGSGAELLTKIAHAALSNLSATRPSDGPTNTEGK